MAKVRNYRHEDKYICSYCEIEEIKAKIESICQYDKNASDGGYLIKSLYFDDYYNSSFAEKENGVDEREKWRIRSYNNDDSVINLERKIKKAGLISKDSCRIDRGFYEDILAGKLDFAYDSSNPLLNKFMLLRETKLLRPVVIVQYYRVPYVYFEGNVRVTLDCDIASSCDFDHFFDDNMNTRMIQTAANNLLEVKYDELLPREIYNAVQLKNMQLETFSKYYLCRKNTL